MRITTIAYISLMCITISCEGGDDYYLDNSTIITPNEEKIETNIVHNEWIYEQMERNYYWISEIPDSLSLNFSVEPTTFFPLLLSVSDRFSWIEINDSYTKSGSYEKFGIEWQEYLGCSGESLCRVLQVEQHSTLHNNGVRRGDWFQNNQNDDNRLDITLGGLDGSYNFIPNRSISVCSESDTEKTRYSVSLDSIYVFDNHKIGYFVYDTFNDTSSIVANPYREELRELITEFMEADIDDLIVDLRYNSGGYVSICKYLSSLMLPDEYLGSIYGYNEYNDILSLELFESTGESEEQLYFCDEDDIVSSNISMQRIYVILTNKSYSASEAFANVLSPIMEVVRIGTNSGGKGVGSYTIANDNYEYQIQPITFRYYNRDHETVPDSGLVPTIYADESLEEVIYELGDTRELLLLTAIDDILSSESTKSICNDVATLPFTPINEDNPREVKGYVYK